MFSYIFSSLHLHFFRQRAAHRSAFLCCDDVQNDITSRFSDRSFLYRISCVCVPLFCKMLFRHDSVCRVFPTSKQVCMVYISLPHFSPSICVCVFIYPAVLSRCIKFCSQPAADPSDISLASSQDSCQKCSVP